MPKPHKQSSEDHSVIPDPSDSNPIIRASKWIAALAGILGCLAVIVTGIWKVGRLVDDLSDAKTELSSLKTSFTEYKKDTERKNEIQGEILSNLRIAVASIQTMVEYRRPQSQQGTHPAVTPRVRFTPPRPVTTAAIHRSPEVSALIRSLPALPSPNLHSTLVPPPPGNRVAMDGDGILDEATIARESNMADVALQRAEILQGHL
jgi:hypothetical protein